MSEEELRPSPGLNMEHGFVRKIERNQHIREQQSKEDVAKKLEAARLARKVGMPTKSVKPTLEIYRPPSLRGSGDFTAQAANKNSSAAVRSSSPTELLNPGAVSPQQGPKAAPLFNMNALPHYAVSLHNGNSSPLSPSVPYLFRDMSSSSPMQLGPRGPGMMMTRSASFNVSSTVPTSLPLSSISASGSSSSVQMTHTSKVHFQLQVPSSTALSSQGKPSIASFGLKRSKSMGAADTRLSISNDYDLAGFGIEVQTLIRKALEDPNRLSPRQLMEVVRHVFNRVIDNNRYAEAAARLCMTVIEKEKTETFLESLLNSCREWYHERDRLLRSFPSTSFDLPAMPTNQRWIAYVTFMYEMYARLKTRQRSSGAVFLGASAVSAGPMLLSLLCECCHVFLQPPSLLNSNEIECLFFVLTSIGRDLENELPQKMHQLVAAVRDAFINPSISSFIRKTLLQLIELHASNWQLTTPAVTYYYPRCQEQK